LGAEAAAATNFNLPPPRGMAQPPLTVSRIIEELRFGRRSGMKFKLGVGLAIALFLILMFLPGMLGKLIGLAVSLLVWGASGYLAGKLLQGEGYGLLGNILLGLVGGFVGSLLVTIFGITGLVKLPFLGGIVVGALGSMVVVVVAGLLGAEGDGE